MRPLFHPSIDDVSAEAVLHALSDPVRAAIFAQIKNEGRVDTSAAFKMIGGREIPIPKSSLSTQIRILREAGLIRSERHGIEVRHFTRWDELDTRFPGLLDAICEAYKAAMPGAKRPPAARKPAKRAAGAP